MLFASCVPSTYNVDPGLLDIDESITNSALPRLVDVFIGSGNIIGRAPNKMKVSNSMTIMESVITP